VTRYYECWETALTIFSSCSKLLALLISVFLLAANLDNVPDCPELLNSKGIAFSSGHVYSLVDVTIHPDYGRGAAGAFYLPFAAPEPLFTVLEPPSAPFTAGQMLYEAADPSPPSA
jgi:hypothetical protein